MSQITFLSVFLVELLMTIPYRFLSYGPYRHQLRLPIWLIILLIGITQTAESASFAYVTLQEKPARWIEYILALVCIILYFTAIRADKWKQLFLYIFIFDYMTTIRGIAFFTEAMLFYDPGMRFYSFRSGCFQLFWFAVTAPFIYHFLEKTKDRISQSYAPFFWRVIWLLPAFTTMTVLMYTLDISADTVLTVNFLLSRILLILVMIIVYHILLHTLDTIQSEASLSEQAMQQEHLLAAEHAQFSQLVRHMDETRQAKHDLSQHLRLINSYIESDDREALREYIARYEQSIPKNPARIWCKNHAVNTLISYYSDECRKSSVRFTSGISLPEHLPISEPDFCSVIGNLLENAYAACLEAKDLSPSLRINAKTDGQQIIITIDNTCAGEPIMIGNAFRSTKHAGMGIGTASVRAIAERYHGSADFRYRDHTFYASVLLYAGKPEKMF